MHSNLILVHQKLHTQTYTFKIHNGSMTMWHCSIFWEIVFFFLNDTDLYIQMGHVGPACCDCLYCD